VLELFIYLKKSGKQNEIKKKREKQVGPALSSWMMTFLGFAAALGILYLNHFIFYSKEKLKKINRKTYRAGRVTDTSANTRWECSTAAGGTFIFHTQ
jgi:hypothetical protein